MNHAGITNFTHQLTNALWLCLKSAKLLWQAQSVHPAPVLMFNRLRMLRPPHRRHSKHVRFSVMSAASDKTLCDVLLMRTPETTSFEKISRTLLA